MVIIETPIFTKLVVELLPDDEYRELQWALIANPEVGWVIPRGHGLRKLRWTIEGRGKSGGLRIIYYYHAEDERIYLIFPYKKSDQEDLTKVQLRKLSNYVRNGVL